MHKNVILPFVCMGLSYMKGRMQTVFENSMLKRISKEYIKSKLEKTP
jgi:ABC-type dipeptide/oligopeptide/nickel transport system permease component